MVSLFEEGGNIVETRGGYTQMGWDGGKCESGRICEFWIDSIESPVFVCVLRAVVVIATIKFLFVVIKIIRMAFVWIAQFTVITLLPRYKCGSIHEGPVETARFYVLLDIVVTGRVRSTFSPVARSTNRATNVRTVS